MVIQLDSKDLIGIYTPNVTHSIITMPINSKHGIRLSLDTPLNNTKNLNTRRPAVLLQYFANDVHVICQSEKIYSALHLWFWKWYIFCWNGSIEFCDSKNVS